MAQVSQVIQVLNEELIRLHDSYKKALEIENEYIKRGDVNVNTPQSQQILNMIGRIQVRLHG